MKLVVIFLALSLVSAQDSAQDFITANKYFTLDVYQQLANFRSGNFLVSPFSAEAALAFAQSGAKGESAQELRLALRLPNDKDKIEKGVKNVLSKLKSSDSFTLRNANKMYVKKGLSVKGEFNYIASTVYDAYIEPIDFADFEEAANTINHWVKRQTHGKIKNLISQLDLDEQTRAVLVNALYLRVNWSNPFHLSSTKQSGFYTRPNEITFVDTLRHYGEDFNYYDHADLQAQFLELPFKNGVGSMVVVLPNEKNGLARLENRLEEVFFTPSHRLTSQYLNVAIPKFKIGTQIDFKRILKNLGVEKAFDPFQADFSNIVDTNEPLYLSKVAQKTFIDVSENGIEAAAATNAAVVAVMSARLDQPKNFIANHPFIFYIKINDLILFAGRVTDPTKH